MQEEAVKYNVDGTRRDCFNTKKDEKYDPKSGRNFNEAERIQKYLQSHVSNFLMLFTTTLRIVRDCVFTYIELHCYYIVRTEQRLFGEASLTAKEKRKVIAMAIHKCIQ